MVTHYSGADIDGFLASYADSRGDSELIVVDCGSTDDTVDRLRASSVAATVLLGPNVGYAGGWNRGLSVVSPSVTAVMFVNPDLTFGPTMLVDLATALEEYPAFGAVSPTIRNQSGEISYAGGSFDDGTLVLRFSGTPPRSSVPQMTQAIHGAAVMVRRAVLDEIAPFDERYFLFREEAALMLQLRAAGWQMGYVPAAEVTHRFGRSFAPYGRRHRAYYLTRNHLLFTQQVFTLSRWSTIRRATPELWRRRRSGTGGVGRALVTVATLDVVALVHFVLGRTGPRRRLLFSRPFHPDSHRVVDLRQHS